MSASIALPRTLPEAQAALAAAGPKAEVRAGATDLQERRHLRISRGPLVDLRDLDGLDLIEATEVGGLRLGARVTVAQLQHDPLVLQAFPGLAATARGLATPAIRARATVAGNLLQDVRCWYYRTPDFHCLKKGGSTCLARVGDHRFHACVDLGSCAAPHPSTLAVALLALDAQVHTASGRHLSMPELFGQEGDPRLRHALDAGELIEAIELPAAEPGWQAAYHRSIHRSRAEWPLVEAYVGLRVENGIIQDARVAMGGVANRPLRLSEVEQALVGLPADPVPKAALAKVQDRATGAAESLPGSAWKAPLMTLTLVDTLTLALAAPVATPLVDLSSEDSP